MIPAEAVEAATEAFVRCAQGFVAPAPDDVFKESVTAAVEAAAPYMRKPQRVTLTRELHALPNYSVIRTDKGFVFEKNGHWWSEPGTRDPSLAEDIALPATVLHRGGEVIPPEAVEAAAKEIDAPSEPAAQEIARRALEAAAPHMLAEAWDEGHDAGFTYGAFQGRVQESPNPYMLNNEGGEMNDFQFPSIRVTPPNLEEANKALAQMAEQLRGLKMYNTAEIEAIKAAAYDEGFTACAGEHTKQREDPSHPITRMNPYKATRGDD